MSDMHCGGNRLFRLVRAFAVLWAGMLSLSAPGTAQDLERSGTVQLVIDYSNGAQKNSRVSLGM